MVEVPMAELSVALFILQEIKDNPFNYDAWFDYIRLIESDGTVEQVCDSSRPFPSPLSHDGLSHLLIS